ncbi:hypothetical protein ATANTOWER_017972 [Ataeniobius toweri]|uniref:Uncharacterized protein n=1 Tax=Ataeniobius toweri TaxID=208326 RepID=A0ABU7AYX4_9TELE|nr:hypothetical protein [Ataeniobius toweri]
MALCVNVGVVCTSQFILEPRPGSCAPFRAVFMSISIRFSVIMFQDCFTVSQGKNCDVCICQHILPTILSSVTLGVRLLYFPSSQEGKCEIKHKWLFQNKG